MKSNLYTQQRLNSKVLLNPEQLWAIENELMDIPVQFRENFWQELLKGFVFENSQQEL